jgi:hypothetical protein
MKDLNKSISQIQGWIWNQAIPNIEDSSYEECNFYRLHKIPINKYKTEDIYFMIEQETCLDFLVPMALNILNDNILIKAEDYSGDLLIRILRLSPEFWSDNQKYYFKFINILRKNQESIENFNFVRSAKSELNLLLKNYKI